MSIQIRRIVATDHAAWLRLFAKYVAFYDATVADDVMSLTWHRLLAGDDGMLGLIAVDDSAAPLGIAALVFHRSTWSPTSYCYLEDLYVDDAARGRGIGRALIGAVYREADARGATRTYWATRETNSTARHLYDGVATLTDFVQYRR